MTTLPPVGSVDGQPLVSIIIIFLNAERFLQEAIDSVFAQTYPHWELLLVDDGSADTSTDVARRLAARLPARVRYLEHEGHQNRGMSATRNLGLRYARGAYIAFLDSDDVWLPRKLEEQVALMETHPEAGMLYGRTLFWFSWPQSWQGERDSLSHLSVPPDTLIAPPTLLTSNYPLVGDMTPSTSNLLLRRGVAESVGGFEDDFRGLYEDQAFLVKVYLTTPVFVADQCWDKYRQHADSCVELAKRTGQARAARRGFLVWCERLLEREGIKDPEIWRALRRALWPHRHPILCAANAATRALAEETAWLWLRLRVRSAGFHRRIRRKSVGWIRATRPVGPSAAGGLGATTLSWASRGTDAVEIHVDAPDGPLFYCSGPSSEATTGHWVRDKMRFYLQDVSRGQFPDQQNTLAVLRVRSEVPAMRIGRQVTRWLLGSRSTRGLDESRPVAVNTCDPRPRPLGTIRADPNPIPLSPLTAGGIPSRLGATTLSWTVEGAEIVEVRIGAPDGELFSRSGPTGSGRTGDWVTDGMTFFLQDACHGSSVSDANTLATVVVNVGPPAEPVPSRFRALAPRSTGAGPGPDERPDDPVPPVGHVDFGSFRRLIPISRMWGSDRGRPVDRYYIENFLQACSTDIRGRVLEIANDRYTRRFGGDQVTQRDVLAVESPNPLATIIADLADAPHVPSDTFDCIICTQTLQLIYDTAAAVRTVHRLLKPGGVALVTLPGITHIGDPEWGPHWCWSFTTASARRLFQAVFAPHQTQVEAYGNVLVAISFLQGLSDHELLPDELDYRDPAYEVLITVRAVKATPDDPRPAVGSGGA